MIKYSNLKMQAKKLKIKIGMDAYSKLDGMVIKIIELAAENAHREKSPKLRDYQFDNILISRKIR